MSRYRDKACFSSYEAATGYKNNSEMKCRDLRHHRKEDEEKEKLNAQIINKWNL